MRLLHTGMHYSRRKPQLKNMLSRSTLKEFKEIYVDSLKPQNHNWTWRDMERLMEVYISHEEQGIETSKKSRNSSSSSSRTKFINVASEREGSSDREADRNKERRKRERSVDSRASSVDSRASHRSNKECTNCGGNHMVRDCTSLKCGHCGGRFDSAQERQKHWGQWHSGKSNRPPSKSGTNTRGLNPKSSSPYPRKKSGYHSDNSKHSSASERVSKRHSSHKSKYDRKSSKSHYRDHKKRQLMAKEASSDEEEAKESGTDQSESSALKH